MISPAPSWASFTWVHQRSRNQPAARPRPSACRGVRTDVERWRGGLPPPRLAHRRRWPSHRAAASLRGRRHRPRTPTPSSRVGLSVPTLSSGEPARAAANLRRNRRYQFTSRARTISTPFACCSRGTALANAPVTLPDQPEGTDDDSSDADQGADGWPPLNEHLRGRFWTPARCSRSAARRCRRRTGPTRVLLL